MRIAHSKNLLLRHRSAPPLKSGGEESSSAALDSVELSSLAHVKKAKPVGLLKSAGYLAMATLSLAGMAGSVAANSNRHQHEIALSTEQGERSLSPLDLSEIDHATGIHHFSPDEAQAPDVASVQGTTRERRQYSYVANALATGEATGFHNDEGDWSAFIITRNADKNGLHTYTVRQDRSRYEVSIHPQVDNVIALGRITDLFSQQAEQFRGAVSNINVHLGPNPDDSDWAERYGMPHFRSAATGGGGNINFYNGLSQVKESVFDHEFGHNVGGAIRKAQEQQLRSQGQLREARRIDNQTGDADSPNVPRGYSQAKALDGNGISNYGNRSIGEDFAEFFEAYQEGSEKGQRRLNRLRETFPNRYSLFEREVLSRRIP